MKLQVLFLVCVSFICTAQSEDGSPQFIVLEGDSTILSVNNYESGLIQWQVKDDTYGEWFDIQGARDTFFIVSAESVEVSKYFRSVVSNSRDGKTLVTDPIKLEKRTGVSELELGDAFAGGFVFHVQDTSIYVIGDSVFLAPWGCPGINLSGANGKEIDDGIQNTIDIIKDCPHDSIIAKVIWDLDYNGFTDWYLPSLEELRLGVTVLDAIDQLPWGGFDPFYTSTEFDENTVRVITKEAGLSTVKKNQLKKYGQHPHAPVEGPYPSLAVRKHSWSMKIKTSYDLSFKERSETGWILITVPDSNNSITQFNLIDAIVDNGDSLVWEHKHGEFLSGSGLGPVQIGYDFGGYTLINVYQYTATGDTLIYESDFFRPHLFRPSSIELPRMYWGDIKTADIDQNGWVDFLLTGRDTTQVYFNIDGFKFEPQNGILPNLSRSFADFGDFNNDGYPDLLISGLNRTDSVYSSTIYQNVQGQEWKSVPMSLPGLVHGFAEWVDFNGDGYLDFLISGQTKDSVSYTQLFEGDGSGAFEPAPIQLEEVSFSTGSFGDHNNDNLPDLIISGGRDSNRYASLYTNHKGVLKEVDFDFVAVDNGSANWADYDNDGWLDFSISGTKEDIVMNPVPMANSNDYNNIASVSFKHYLNDQNGGFLALNNGTLGNQFVKSDQSPGDLDNDGLCDIALVGQSAIAVAQGGTGGGPKGPLEVNRSRIVTYRNVSTSANLTFRPTHANLPAPLRTSNDHYVERDHFFRNIALSDFDQDGRVDIIRNGNSPQFPTSIYYNISYRKNMRPGQPKIIGTPELSCDSVHLRWQEAVDDLTPSHVLTYDVYIGTQPGMCDIVSRSNDYKLQIPNFKLRRSLPIGTYYWSVRVRDNAHNLSEWAPEQSFTIGFPESPTIFQRDSVLVSEYALGNQWHDQDGPISGAQQQEYIPQKSGNYYSVVTKDGCWTDTTNVIEFRLTSSSDYSFSEIKVFPNPFEDDFVVMFGSPHANYSIINELGVQVKSGSVTPNGLIELKGAPSGNYLIQVSDRSGSRYTLRIVKR